MDSNLWILLGVMVAMTVALAFLCRRVVTKIKQQHDLRAAKREVEGYKFWGIIISVAYNSFTMVAKNFTKDSICAELIVAIGVPIFVGVAVHYYRQIIEFIDEETQRLEETNKSRSESEKKEDG